MGEQALETAHEVGVALKRATVGLEVICALVLTVEDEGVPMGRRHVRLYNVLRLRLALERCFEAFSLQHPLSHQGYLARVVELHPERLSLQELCIGELHIIQPLRG